MNPMQNMLITEEMKSFMLLSYIVMVISWWKIFEKAGIEGWKALIPFYNMWILTEIAGRPGWLVIVMMFSTMLGDIAILVILVIQIIIYSDLAKAFGKELAFTIGIIVLPIVFFPILAFGKSTLK